MQPCLKTEAIDVEIGRCKYDQVFTTWIKRSRDLFVHFDRQYRILYANPSFCRSFGISQEAAVGVDFDRLGVPHDLAAQWRRLLGRVFDEGKERSQDLWLPTQNGLRCFRLRVAPEANAGEAGEIESVWAGGRDITEVRGTQSVLGETEARFKAIVSNVPGLVFQMSSRKFDHSLDFHYLSDGAIALCGITPERIQRNPEDFIALIHGDDLSAFHHSMHVSMETLANWRWEGRLSGSPTGERWVSLQATPRRMNTGSVLWDGIVFDITDSKRNAERLRQSEAFLRDLCVRVAAVREEEKQTIACEIHDELGQLLTALKLDLSSMCAADGLNAKALTKVHRMESLADDILHRVRDIASTLRPKVLDLGLAPAIEWLAQEFTYRTGAICRLALEGLELCEGLDATRTTAIFRIVQESLTNVTRHANARRVAISFASCEQGLHLLIHDDGRGFDPALVEVGKIGLSGLRERAVILGADLQINSSAQTGTTLEVMIPIESLVRDGAGAA